MELVRVALRLGSKGYVRLAIRIRYFPETDTLYIGDTCPEIDGYDVAHDP